MVFMKTIDDCVRHVTGFSSISQRDHEILSRYIEDHKYFLEKEHNKSISLDEVFTSFEEYVLAPVMKVVNKKVRSVYNFRAVEALIAYIDCSNHISERLKGNRDWFAPEPELVCDYMLWMYYYKKVALYGNILDKVRLVWYSNKTKCIRRDHK